MTAATDTARGRVPLLVVSVHDVSPATEVETLHWCADLDRRDIRASLLVIPGPWRGTSPSDWTTVGGWLRDRAAMGDEIVQHGWTHQAGPEGTALRRAVGRVVARGAGEFAALGELEAMSRLIAGRAVLTGLGLPVVGFTPPGWLQSPGALVALRRLGFRFTTSHLGVRDLRTGAMRRALALSHRAAGWGETSAARLIAALARRSAARGWPVRIALHPDDLDRPGLRTVSLAVIDAVLEAGGHATTYGRLLDTVGEGGAGTRIGPPPGLGGPQ
jgi:uncharacterized protein